MLRANQIVRAIADAAERWRNADFPPRVRATAAIRARTGYAEPVVDFALDALFGTIDAVALEATISGELGGLVALDDFVPRRGLPDVFYSAAGEATIVSSDTTIGVAIPALCFALCAKSCVHVKDRDDRLVAAFAESIVEELPALAEAISTAVWRGDDETAADAHLARAGVVVAYGRGSTLAAIRARLPPEARFVGYGHRTSVGYVTRETLGDEARARVAAGGAARDALLYDGDGCLSLHALFVERGAAIAPRDFLTLVASACADVAVEFPASYATPDAAVASYRRAARFRAAQGDGAVANGDATHLVVLDPPHAESPPLLRRTLALYSVDGPADALAYVRRHALPLEAVALSDGNRADASAFARESGAARIAALGTLQKPPLGGEHGGHGRILPFVRAIYRA